MSAPVATVPPMSMQQPPVMSQTFASYQPLPQQTHKPQQQPPTKAAYPSYGSEYQAPAEFTSVLPSAEPATVPVYEAEFPSYSSGFESASQESVHSTPTSVQFDSTSRYQALPEAQHQEFLDMHPPRDRSVTPTPSHATSTATAMPRAVAAEVSTGSMDYEDDNMLSTRSRPSESPKDSSESRGSPAHQHGTELRRETLGVPKSDQSSGEPRKGFFKSLLGGFWGTSGARKEPAPVQADLGEKNQFYYDPVKKKWVNKAVCIFFA